MVGGMYKEQYYLLSHRNVATDMGAYIIVWAEHDTALKSCCLLCWHRAILFQWIFTVSKLLYTR